MSTKNETTVKTQINGWLALGAVAGPVLFTLTWLVLGFVSPGFTIFGTTIAPYSPISAGISGLGLGLTAPVMNSAFVLSGLLLLVGVVGIFQSIQGMGARGRWTCIAILGLSGVGLVVDGLFTLESFFPHFLGFAIGIGATVPGFVISGVLLRRTPGWRRFGSWLILGSPLTVALTVLYFLTFSPTAEGARTGIAGLSERLLVVEVFFWFVSLGWLAFRRTGSSHETARHHEAPSLKEPVPDRREPTAANA